MLSQFQTDRYSKLGYDLQLRLKLKNNEKIRIYETAQTALFDTVLSLQQFLLHKPQIGIVKKGSSLIEAMTPMWLRNQTPMQFKNDIQTWFEYIESLSKDTNFVLWSSENEITGEIIIPKDEVSEIHKRLADKRIYSIQIQHQGFELPTNLSKYSVIIRRPSLFSNSLSYVILGEKIKAPSIMGEFQNLKWMEDHAKNLNLDLFPKMQSQELEKKWDDKKLFYFNYFSTPCERMSDRLVFWLQDMTGLSIKQYLGLNDTQAFAPSELPFWYLQFWNHWWKEAESEKLLKGLLVLNAQVVIEDSDFTKKMEKAISDMRSLSQWSVTE